MLGASEKHTEKPANVAEKLVHDCTASTDERNNEIHVTGDTTSHVSADSQHGEGDSGHSSSVSEQSADARISHGPNSTDPSHSSEPDPSAPPKETPEVCLTSETTEMASDPPMSKRQKKRLAKRAEFLARLPEMRRAERQKRREKRSALAAAGTLPKKPRFMSMAEGGCQVGVCIDLSFDDLMEERDLRKCLKQVQRCYAANRRGSPPLQLRLSSLLAVQKKLPDVCAEWSRWDVHAHQQHFTEVLEKESVTYLSSDSPDVLDRLEPGRTYIIGGLVDHNHHKGVCYRRARQAGLATARLPIEEYMQLRTRQVLTIDHVFSILLRVSAGDSWQQAFCSVLPPRKGAVPLSQLAEIDGVAEDGAAGSEDEGGEGEGVAVVGGDADCVVVQGEAADVEKDGGADDVR